MEYINIQPKQITLNVTKITINVLYLELNRLAIIKVELFDNNSKLLDTYNFQLDGVDYDDWHDDDYLVDYVCQKYNFSLI